MQWDSVSAKPLLGGCWSRLIERVGGTALRVSEYCNEMLAAPIGERITVIGREWLSVRAATTTQREPRSVGMPRPPPNQSPKCSYGAALRDTGLMLNDVHTAANLAVRSRAASLSERQREIHSGKQRTPLFRAGFPRPCGLNSRESEDSSINCNTST